MLNGFLYCFAPGDLKCDVLAVHGVLFAVVEFDLDVDHGIIRQYAFRHLVLDSLVNTLPERLTDNAAKDLVYKLVSGPARGRFDPYCALSELPSTARLFLVAIANIGLVAYRFAIGNFRKLCGHFHATALQPVQHQANMLLTDSRYDELLGLGIHFYLKGRIRLGETPQTFGNLCLVAATPGFHGPRNHRDWVKRYNKRLLVFARYQGVANPELLNLGGGDNGTRACLVYFPLVFALRTKELGDFDQSAGMSQGDGIPCAYETRIDAEIADFAHKFIRYDLENLPFKRPSEVNAMRFRPAIAQDFFRRIVRRRCITGNKVHDFGNSLVRLGGAAKNGNDRAINQDLDKYVFQFFLRDGFTFQVTLQ